MPDPMDWLLETLDPELHHDVQTLAAKAGVSVQEISERLLRLGMVAPQLASTIKLAVTEVEAGTIFCNLCGMLGTHDPMCTAPTVLAAYDAALNPEGDPDA